MRKSSIEANGKVTTKPVKRPSTTLTSGAEVKIEPLFSLPENLMDSSVCKRFKQKLESSTIRKNRTEAFLKSSFTGKRLRREEFRKYLIGLVVKPEVTEQEDNNASRDLDRYYYYIRNGIDTIHVTSIDEDVIRKIISLIPDILCRRFRFYVESLIEEVKDEFIFSLKKSIVEFVLTDPFDLETRYKVRYCSTCDLYSIFFFSLS